MRGLPQGAGALFASQGPASLMLGCLHCPGGLVEVGWELDGGLSECSDCGHSYRVFGDETYNDETGECFDWWAIVEPHEGNPW